MEFLMAVRTLIATTVMLFCSLWLARQLKIHRPRLPVSAVLILSLIMLFEPGMLAFLVWVVHDIASVNGGLMIHAYTFVKASVAIYLLFILQKRQGAGIVDRIAAETALVPYRKYLLFAIPQIQIFRTFTASFHCFPDALGGYHDRDRTIYDKFPFPAVARLQLPAVELDRKGKTH